MFTLFYNGKIFTLNPNQPTVSVLLTDNQRIVFCGDESDINLPDYAVNKINLNGRFVLPAFIDCHTHFVLSASKYDQILLDRCQSFDETLNEIKSQIHRFENGQWIRGCGWNANLWEEKIPHKKHLDEISTRHPIALYSKDLHTLWLNSPALQRCHIDPNVPDVFVGKIKQDDHGEPTGLLVEDACKLVEQNSEPNLPEHTMKNIHKFSEELLAAGITSVHTMEGMDEFAILQQMALQNQIKTRVCFHPPSENMESLANARIYSGFGNEWFRLGGLKYFVDGSIGSQTAEMFDNYEGLDHSGIEILTESELYKKISKAASKGLGSTIHAIGDKAIHKSLNALEKSINTNSPVPLRHRIEHSQIVHPDDTSRFNNLDIIASMQPLHIADDVKTTNKYLGNRAKFAYPVKSLMNCRTKVVFGSDSPVADFNPLKGMLAAITRKFNLLKTEPSWNADQIISIEQTIAAYTRDAAYASYEESIKGTLEAGKLTDFVVLSENIINAANVEESLRNVEVLATVLNGEIVYRHKKFD